MTPHLPMEKSQEELRLETILGNLLRAGVLAAAAIVLLGGVVFLVRHGAEPAEHAAFNGQPEELRTRQGVLFEVLRFRGRGLIQLGILLLIATPVARVLFSAYAFARLRDSTYVVITLIVLAVLTYSLFFG